MADRTFSVQLTAGTTSFTKGFKSAAESAKDLADVLGSATGQTGAWTEAQQRSAQAMSRAHDEALKLNQALDSLEFDRLHDEALKANEALEAIAFDRAHDEALQLNEAFDNLSFEKAHEEALRLNKAFDEGLNLDRAHDEALRMNEAFDASGAKAGRFADAVGRTSTTLARAADSFGLPAGPLRALDDVMDVAELGFQGLTKAAVGFNVATIGVVGAGVALGAGIGSILNRFESVRSVADDATRSLYDFLAANKLFGESTRDQGAGQEAGLAQFRIAMAAKYEEAITKQAAALREAGKTDKEIADFYKGRLNPELEKKLGLTKEDVKAEQEHAAAAKRAAEAFKSLLDQLSGGTAQQEVDQLARAFKVLGVEGVADLEALRQKLIQLEKQGAKITDKGLLGVLKGGKVEIPAELDIGTLDIGEDTANLLEQVGKAGLEAQVSFNEMAAAAARAEVPVEEIATALESAGASSDQVRVALTSIPALGLGAALKAGLSAGLKSLPQVILGAIQGGGDVGRSIGAHLGGSIGEGLAKPLTDKLTSVLGKSLGGALGSIIPGLGSLLGSQLGSLISKGISKLGSLFGIGGNKVIMQVNDLRDAFFEAQGGFVELQKKLSAVTSQDLVKKIFDAKTVDEFNAAVAEVNGLLGLQTESQEELNAALSKYGLSSAVTQAKELEEAGAQLYKEFRLITEGGLVPVNEAIAAMGPNIVDFVNEARASGTAIPEAMRPMIDALIQSGQLVDENGQAYASAEDAGITFSQTMSEQFDLLIQKLDQWLAALTGAEIPPLRVPVQYDVSGTPPGSDAPPSPDNVPGYAEGTGLRFVDFGQESIVALHGREMVLTEDQMAELGGMGSSVSVAYTQNIVEDPYNSAEGRLSLRRRTLEIAQRESGRMLSGLIQAGQA